MEAFDNTQEIFRQIEATKVFINTHNSGHFISAAQLQKLKELLPVLKSADTKEETFDQSLLSSLELEDSEQDKEQKVLLLLSDKEVAQAERKQLELELVRCDDKVERVRLNQAIQAKTSKIAKLIREIKRV